MGHPRKRGKPLPGVNFESELPLLVDHTTQLRPQIGGELVHPVKFPDIHGKFAHFQFFQPQYFHGIEDVDIAVTATRAADTFQNAAHLKGLAVDRSIPVGGNHHHGVTDFDSQSPGKQFRDQNLPRLQSAHGSLPFHHTRGQERASGEFLLRVDPVHAYIRSLLEIAEHAAELDTFRV